MSRPPRPLVAFVSDAEEFAGAESYMIHIVEALAEGYDFVLVLGVGAARETREKAERAGARIVSVRGLRRRPSPLASLRLWSRLARLRPALIHINASDQGDAVAAFAIARAGRTPTIATLHNVIPGRARWRDAVGVAMLRSADQIIAVSDRLGRYLIVQGVRNVIVKNALNPPLIDRNARGLLALDPESFVIGGIGRLHAQKGWDVLCEAAALVHEAKPDLRFIVIGDGPERDSLASHPDADHVSFEGYVADASTLLGAFDLLAIPSRYEGLGLVAIEGMFAGVPIVASGVEGLVEAVGDCGRIVPPNRADLLAQAILELAADPDERAAIAARARVRAERLFHLDRMVTQTAAVYASVLSGRIRPNRKKASRPRTSEEEPLI
jgi:glycosyltransferase involved in cell wall biosynthesis